MQHDKAWRGMLRHGKACRGMARHVEAWGSNGCDMGKVKQKHGCNAGRHGGGMEVSWVCHG
jgi:hypothetical protein